MRFLAQAATSVWDNDVLDEFEIPFGEWIDQSVDWIFNNTRPLLDAFAWPFEILINTLVNDFLAQISWIWVVLGMFLIASLVRNVKVGTFVALALTVCGLLGNAYWIETARTIGFIAVAVILCVMIGIPVGIMAGRVDSVWQVVRPVLDAMQVVHSFVYMLPFIFFWGIGEVSATMVTMVFALPPLIRLTNLGIRQVPSDVVEASRGYGSSELRVLIDVQLPLARPAIMTGINQTLLLAISMLGIAAIMGAGGLGRLLFRALSNQNVALAASGGLAFFLVAVVLDRMSQRDGDGTNLFRRIHQAWAHRRDPEALLPDSEGENIVVFKAADRYEQIKTSERLPMLITLIGGAVAAISVFLPWTIDAGKFSAFGRRADENLSGSFNGLDASGGSWFGIFVVVLGVFIVAAVVASFRNPGRAQRWLAADGAAIAAITALVLSGAHLLGSAPPNATDPGTGIGVLIAVLGSIAATAGAVLWLRVAPHSPLHPLRLGLSWARLIGAGIAMFVLVVGMYSGWSFDGREDVVISAELQAQIDELTQEAADNPADAGPISARLSALMASARASGSVITDGVSSDGTRFGLIALLPGLLAVAATLLAAGVVKRSEHEKWVWSSIATGLGYGIAALAMAWVLTQVRSADRSYVTGVGSFMTMLGGVFIVASASKVLNEFRRSKVYDDEQPATLGAPKADLVEELV